MATNDRALRPMPLPLALLYFGIPALVFVVSVYLLIPFFIDQGLTEFMSYSLSLLIQLVLMFIASLVSLRLEGYPVNWESIQGRFRAFKYWDWLSLLPVCLSLSFVAQKRRNTWPGMITHFVINGLSMVPILGAILS